MVEDHLIDYYEEGRKMAFEHWGAGVRFYPMYGTEHLCREQQEAWELGYANEWEELELT